MAKSRSFTGRSQSGALRGAAWCICAQPDAAQTSAKTRWPRSTRGQRGSRCDELERGVRPSSQLSCHQLRIGSWYAANISSRTPAGAANTPVVLRSPTALCASAFKHPSELPWSLKQAAKPRDCRRTSGYVQRKPLRARNLHSTRIDLCGQKSDSELSPSTPLVY